MTMNKRHATRSAVMLILSRQGECGLEVLLQLRRGTGYADGQWDLAATGHVDAGESMKMAACREAREELGIAVVAEDLRFATLSHANGDVDSAGDYDEVYYNAYFHALRFDGEPAVMEPHKCGGLGWFPISALPENMIANRRRALARWQSGEPYAEEGWG